MQALLVSADKPPRIEFTRDYPKPEPAPDELLVHVRYAGICATDLEIVRGYMAFAGVPGHEFVGTVEAGSAEWVGRRVVAEINCACGHCDVCKRGRPIHCPNRTVLGIAGRNGAFAEFLTVPAQNCRHVPDEITDRQAVFVEPLGAAAHVLDAAPLDEDMRVAVLGTGRLGLLVAQVLARTPCQLTVVGRNAATLALGRRRGWRTICIDELRPAAEYDVVVDCTGTPEGFRLALALCRPCGTIVLKSTYAEPAALNLAPVVINEVRIVGSRCGAFDPALRLLAEHAIEVDDMIAGVYPLAKGVEALKAAALPGTLKVLLEPGSA